MKCKQQKNKNWAYIYSFLVFFCSTASSSVVPIPGTFSWPLAARGKPRRGMLRRAVFSDVQRKALEKMFQKQKYISKPDRKKLASKLGLKDSQVKKQNTSAFLLRQLAYHIYAQTFTSRVYNPSCDRFPLILISCQSL